MNNLLFIDVEATGTEEEDRLCQLAYRINGRDVNELFKPPVQIKIAAMAIHHITEKMVADKPDFRLSGTFTDLADLSGKDAIFVAHNAKYDLGMIAKEGITFQRHICTLKIARHIDTGGRFDNHTLQYLRYFYGIEIEATAHDAFGDILVLEAVFSKLYEDFKAFEFGDRKVSEYEVLTRMIEISAAPSLLTHFRFGKYNGKAVGDVAKQDRGYLEWLLGMKLQKPEGEDDWIFTLKHHLNLK